MVSCRAPAPSGYPTNTLLTCPIINLPAITLNGVTQTTTDLRPTRFTCRTTVVARARAVDADQLHGPDVCRRRPPACASVAAFCNQSTREPVAGNAVISGSETKAISVPVCADYTGNADPVTPGPARDCGRTLDPVLDECSGRVEERSTVQHGLHSDHPAVGVRQGSPTARSSTWWLGALIGRSSEKSSNETESGRESGRVAPSAPPSPSRLGGVCADPKGARGRTARAATL